MPIIDQKTFFQAGGVKSQGTENDIACTDPSLSSKPGFFDSVSADWRKRQQAVDQGKERQAQGQQTLSETLLQSLGNAAGFVVGDLPSDALKSTYNAIPDNIKQPVEDVAKKGLKFILENDKSPDTLALKAGLSALSQGMKKYDAWSKDNPRAAANLESFVNIASIIPGEKAVGAGVDGAEAGAKLATDVAGDVGTKVLGGVTENAKGIVQKGYEKASELATSMDPSVVTELTKEGVKPYTALAKVTEYTDAAKKAIADNSLSTPMEIAGQKAEKALSEINTQISKLGSQKKALTISLGKNEVGTIVDDARTNIRRNVMEGLGAMFTKDGELKNAPGRTMKIASNDDISLLKSVDGKLAEIQKNPTFQKVDDAIDFIHNKLYERSGVGAVPVNSEVEGILKSTIGKLNSQLKEIGGTKYSELNSQLSDLLDVRGTLNKGLGSDANRGAALMKQLFSPAGTMPRKLFSRVKDLTGIDLVNEATIAKWAMENVGDVRQASLLKQVLGGEVTSKSGLVKSLIDKGAQALQDSELKAKKVIKNNMRK